MEADSIKSAQRTDAHLLPCLPHVLLSLLERAEDIPDGNWLEGIGNDPTLTAHVLLAGQAHAAPDDTPQTVERAVAVLGGDTCRRIVHNAAIRNVFGRTNNQQIADLKRQWWRGVLCANIARQIAEQVAYTAPDEARLAALLLAAEQLASWVSADDGSKNGTEQDDGEHPASISGERSAGRGLSYLSLSSFMADAIRYHQEHSERIAESHSLVRIVWLANACADHLTAHATLPQDAAKLFFGTPPDLQRAATLARQLTETAAREFGIELDASIEPADTNVINERRQFRSIPTGPSLRPEQMAADVQIRHRLTREVRDLAMMDGIAQSMRMFTTHRDMLAGCADAAYLLFGLSRSVFFLRAEDDMLRPLPLPGQSTRIAEFAIPTKGGRSLCAQAAERRGMADSFSGGQIAVLDEQIAQTLDRAGVLYLPLSAQGALLGLAAFGVEAHEPARIRKQQRLLGRFARLCAELLQQCDRAATSVDETAGGAIPALRSDIRRAVHEANNPLSIIKNYIKLLTGRLEEDQTASKGLRIIGEEIDRIAATLRTLTISSSAAATPQKNESVEINDVIADLLGLARDTLFAPARISMVTRLAGELPPIATQRDKLKQILLNLLKNAAEAMHDGGTVTVSTRDKVNRDGQSYVEIAISDTGPGMPPAIMDNLFKPVASTKGADHGGLGLSIIGELAETLHISVTCTSDANGTIFQLLIPRILADTR